MKSSLRLAISALVLALLFLRFDFRSVLSRLGTVSILPFLGAFVLYLTSQLVSASRWRLLARAVGFRVSLLRSIWIYLTGMFFGLVTPSTLGSDAARTFYLGQEPPGTARALSTVLFDRLIGLILLVAVGVAALALGPSDRLPSGLSKAAILLGAVLIATWFAAPVAVKLLRREHRLRRLVERDLAPYFRDPRLLTAAAGLSLVIHGLQIGSQKLLATALGLPVPISFVAIYHPMVSIAVAMPLTIGGFGFREAAYAYLLPLAGVSPDAAIALGLLWWAVGALGGLLGGVVFAVSRESAPRR